MPQIVINKLVSVEKSAGQWWVEYDITVKQMTLNRISLRVSQSTQGDYATSYTLWQQALPQYFEELHIAGGGQAQNTAIASNLAAPQIVVRALATAPLTMIDSPVFQIPLFIGQNNNTTMLKQIMPFLQRVAASLSLGGLVKFTATESGLAIDKAVEVQAQVSFSDASEAQLLTKAQVQEAVGNAVGSIDLSGYAQQAQVDSMQNQIDNKAAQGQVDYIQNSLTQEISDIRNSVADLSGEMGNKVSYDFVTSQDQNLQSQIDNKAAQGQVDYIAEQVAGISEELSWKASQRDLQNISDQLSQKAGLQEFITVQDQVSLHTAYIADLANMLARKGSANTILVELISNFSLFDKNNSSISSIAVPQDSIVTKIVFVTKEAFDFVSPADLANVTLSYGTKPSNAKALVTLDKISFDEGGVTEIPVYLDTTEFPTMSKELFFSSLMQSNSGRMSVYVEYFIRNE